MAYRRWRECGNRDYFLIILWQNNVYRINLEDIDFNKKSISLKNWKPLVEGFYEN